MQVKVFEAEDMAATLKKVKESMGPEALILSTRTVRKKGLGLLGRPVVEITAAAARGQKTEVRRQKSGVRSQETGDREEEPAIRGGQPAAGVPLDVREITALKEQLATADLDSIRREISDLKGLVRGFAAEMAEMSQMLTARFAAAKAETESAWLTPVTEVLTSRGIQDEAAAAIIRLARERLTPQEAGSPGSLELFFQETIAGLLQVNGPLLLSATSPRRVALIGPTGVGKTTTIAKLAAAYLKNYGRKLALLTIDTYRIAAVEQLKIYGEIMKLPVEVVITPNQMEEALRRHEDKKLILIDTAGRSPRDEGSIRELAAYLRPELGIENHLVLAATAREQELFETVKRFRHLTLKSFIFTKLDECETFGTLLNVHARNNYPLSYLTNGQRVPEDLMLADPQKIAGLIMGKYSLQRNTHAACA